MRMDLNRRGRRDSQREEYTRQVRHGREGGAVSRRGAEGPAGRAQRAHLQRGGGKYQIIGLTPLRRWRRIPAPPIWWWTGRSSVSSSRSSWRGNGCRRNEPDTHSRNCEGREGEPLGGLAAWREPAVQSRLGRDASPYLPTPSAPLLLCGNPASRLGI
jgi:hypothetical protein